MTPRFWKYFVIGLAICSSLFIIVRGCQNQRTDNPLLQIIWPASYSEFNHQIPIGVSSWSGVFKSSVQDFPAENGRLRVGMYYLEDAKHTRYGSAVCIIDARAEARVSVLVGTDLPIHEEVSQGADYSVLRATNSVEGWVVFTVSKNTGDKRQQ
jgi:hypothetical protein